MIIVTGTIAYDYIMDFPGRFADHILPEQIHQINLSFIVDTFAKRRGGTAGNMSYTLGLLQTPHILFSVAGNDFDEYKKAFEKLNIDLSNVMIDKTQTSSTGFAMTDKQDNQIWGYFYGASKHIPKLELKKVAKKGDWVVIGPSGASGSMSMVRQCVELEIQYMFDPGFILTQVNDEDLSYGVENSSHVIGNDYEINLMTNRVKKWRELAFRKIVITTLGAEGAMIEHEGKKEQIKAVSPKKVVDPTGAGDAFRSGFLAGVERGLDLKTSGQMGAVAASFAIEQYGTQEHIFSLEGFKNRYRQAYSNVLEL